LNPIGKTQIPKSKSQIEVLDFGICYLEFKERYAKIE